MFRLFVLVAVEQETREALRGLDALRIHLEDSLEDGDLGFPVVLARGFLDDRVVLRDRLVLQVFLGEEVGHLESARHVRGVERRHLSQQVEGVASFALALVAVGGGLERGHGFRNQSEPLVQLGKREIDVVPLAIDLGDLLVDRDGLGVEAVAHELLGDLQVGVDRIFGLVAPELEVADFESDVGVPGVGFEQTQVVFEGAVEGALLHMTLCRGQKFSLVDGQEAPQASPPSRSRVFTCSVAGAEAPPQGVSASGVRS